MTKQEKFDHVKELFTDSKVDCVKFRLHCVKYKDRYGEAAQGYSDRSSLENILQSINIRDELVALQSLPELLLVEEARDQQKYIESIFEAYRYLTLNK